ncbi:MAG: Uma2 family endonuclease [Cyanobacteria bacterium P01_A01_bin.105]
MTQTRPRLKTFADFLAYDDGTDNRYELTNGELIEVPPENDDNIYGAMLLYEALKPFVGMRHIRLGGTAVAMPGQPKNRYPDLVVLQPEHVEQMRQLGKSAITLEMRPPMLVVEMVSPGAENHHRDYVDKRNQYEWRGIPEYWIVDPQLKQVTVLALVEGQDEQGQYEETVFEDDARVLSPTFSDWTLTAAEMVSA